jgi:hypothetical protein
MIIPSPKTLKQIKQAKKPVAAKLPRITIRRFAWRTALDKIIPTHK